ncbi:MAG: FAD-binding protein, partial [Ilumatobacteraceae bacterium]
MSSTPRRTFGTITEPARQIDVIHEADVLVVGSGPAGLAAALGAARAAARAAARPAGPDPTTSTSVSWTTSIWRAGSVM